MVAVAAHPAHLVENMPGGEADLPTKFQPCIVILGSFLRVDMNWSHALRSRPQAKNCPKLQYRAETWWEGRPHPRACPPLGGRGGRLHPPCPQAKNCPKLQYRAETWWEGRPHPWARLPLAWRGEHGLRVSTSKKLPKITIHGLIGMKLGSRVKLPLGHGQCQVG